MPVRTSSAAKPLETADRLAQAFGCLSEQDLVRLKRLAQLRSFGLIALDWQDLLQESIVRVLAGSRHWPADVPLMAFLAQTMRSIANEEWASPARQRMTNESDFGIRTAQSSDSEVTINDIAVEEVDPERLILARNSIAHIETIFKDDAEALAILRGFAQGNSPDEIRQEASLTLTNYESAQKRIRRKIAQHLQK